MQWISTFLRPDGHGSVVRVVWQKYRNWISFEQVKKPGAWEDSLGAEGTPLPWPQFCTDHVGGHPTEKEMSK